MYTCEKKYLFMYDVYKIMTSPKSFTYTGWRRETGKCEVDYEIPPRGQVPSARGFVTLKKKA
jgi:hypothetical protein